MTHMTNFTQKELDDLIRLLLVATSPARLAGAGLSDSVIGPAMRLVDVLQESRGDKNVLGKL